MQEPCLSVTRAEGRVSLPATSGACGAWGPKSVLRAHASLADFWTERPLQAVNPGPLRDEACSFAGTDLATPGQSGHGSW
jgi:hypothetical protein